MSKERRRFHSRIPSWACIISSLTIGFERNARCAIVRWKHFCKLWNLYRSNGKMEQGERERGRKVIERKWEKSTEGRKTVETKMGRGEKRGEQRKGGREYKSAKCMNFPCELRLLLISLFLAGHINAAQTKRYYFRASLPWRLITSLSFTQSGNFSKYLGQRDEHRAVTREKWKESIGNRAWKSQVLILLVQCCVRKTRMNTRSFTNLRKGSGKISKQRKSVLYLYRATTRQLRLSYISRQKSVQRYQF